ncbi:hypothetical protein GAGA_0269 [Paraglaciecola agarilytica NO2]|uniref:Uncharacterized protein n=1 Tax=Paraglaciecola agarilytica NO2 TaxID=1125747 RepID=A0ABQ0I1E4_9ALTE|nr:hypothetical protein GAGA_0269 [Paraglaciecola agarilytica NO2]
MFTFYYTFYDTQHSIIMHITVISQCVFRFRLFFAPTLVLFFEGRSAAYLCSFG